MTEQADQNQSAQWRQYVGQTPAAAVCKPIEDPTPINKKKIGLWAGLGAAFGIVAAPLTGGQSLWLTLGTLAGSAGVGAIAGGGTSYLVESFGNVANPDGDQATYLRRAGLDECVVTAAWHAAHGPARPFPGALYAARDPRTFERLVEAKHGKGAMANPSVWSKGPLGDFARLEAFRLEKLEKNKQPPPADDQLRNDATALSAQPPPALGVTPGR